MRSSSTQREADGGGVDMVAGKVVVVEREVEGQDPHSPARRPTLQRRRLVPRSAVRNGIGIKRIRHMWHHSMLPPRHAPFWQLSR